MKSGLQLSVFIVFFSVLIFLSCKHKDDVACTSIFASVSLEVNGGILDSCFTVRNATGDTIRFTNGPFQNSYTVLDDNYQQMLENRQEEFKFTGFKSGNEVVDEIFVISADKCHISKVSGKNSVTI